MIVTEALTDLTGDTALLDPPIVCADAAGSRCGDCPRTNLEPPSESDCPYFENWDGNPTCTKEGPTERQIVGGRRSIGAVDLVMPNLVELAAAGEPLPDTL